MNSRKRALRQLGAFALICVALLAVRQPFPQLDHLTGVAFSVLSVGCSKPAH
jgi:hypothetical protein